MAINKKQKSKRQSKRQSQRGGFRGTTKPHTTVMHTTIPHTTHESHTTPMHSVAQRGGSPASNIVMQDLANPAVMNDYVVSDRIRDPGYDNSLASLEPRCSQKGGSPASSLVMENLTDVAETKPYAEGWKVKGDLNSLNLYQTTGGSRRHRNKRNNNSKHNNKNNSNKNNRRNTRNNKRKNNNKRRTQRGGASDWISSQYSLGNINAPEMSASAVGVFSQSGATARSELMNPSTMGLAGSGYPMGSLEGANVRQVGAPLA